MEFIETLCLYSRTEDINSVWKQFEIKAQRFEDLQRFIAEDMDLVLSAANLSTNIVRSDRDILVVNTVSCTMPTDSLMNFSRDNFKDMNHALSIKIETKVMGLDRYGEQRDLWKDMPNLKVRELSWDICLWPHPKYQNWFTGYIRDWIGRDPSEQNLLNHPIDLCEVRTDKDLSYQLIKDIVGNEECLNPARALGLKLKSEFYRINTIPETLYEHW